MSSRRGMRPRTWRAAGTKKMAMKSANAQSPMYSLNLFSVVVVVVVVVVLVVVLPTG